MFSTFVLGLVKILLAIVILAGMVMVLLGIGMIAKPKGKTDDEKAGELRRELKEEEDVIGTNSVFHTFLSDKSGRRPARKQPSTHRQSR